MSGLGELFRFNMVTSKNYFELSIEHLQSIAGWAAECAQRSLDIYEQCVRNDDRPRKAIDLTKDFVVTGKRTNLLRKAAMDAHRASMQATDAAASAAAKAASLAAASAFTHPFSDIYQARHILGSAANSAFAIELSFKENSQVGAKEIEWAVINADYKVVQILRKMPEQTGQGRRLDELMKMLDQLLRKPNV